MIETKLPKRDCLHCHGSLDAATCVHDEVRPKDGDLTMCIYCGHLMAFTADLSLRELNDEERAWCASSRLIQRALEVRKAQSPVHPDRKMLQ